MCRHMKVQTGNAVQLPVVQLPQIQGPVMTYAKTISTMKCKERGLRVH